MEVNEAACSESRERVLVDFNYVQCDNGVFAFLYKFFVLKAGRDWDGFFLIFIFPNVLQMPEIFSLLRDLQTSSSRWNMGILAP